MGEGRESGGDPAGIVKKRMFGPAAHACTEATALAQPAALALIWQQAL